MIKINLDDIPSNYEDFRAKIKEKKSFAITGLTTLLRLFLLSKIKNPTIFVTATEQQALKYQQDLKNAFDIDAVVMPFQNVSVYEAIKPNLYEYCEQIRILQTKPDIIICPIKVFLEKFPNSDYFKKNSLKIKVGDSIDLKILAKNLVNLGYNKSFILLSK